jgi:hypothetical protein
MCGQARHVLGVSSYKGAKTSNIKKYLIGISLKVPNF